MVSIGQLFGMIFAIVIPVTVAVILFLQIKKKTEKKGLFTTSIYGALGFCWQTMLYFVVYGFVGGALSQVEFFGSGFGKVVFQFITALLYALFTMLGLYWAIYLANMRIRGFDRGITIGLGYGIAYTVWGYIFTYGIPLYYGICMKYGIREVDEDVKQKVQGLAVENMYLFILDMVLYILIVTGITLLMSHYYVTKENRGMTALIPLCVQFVISFLNTLLPYLLPDVVSSVLYHVAMTAAAVYAMWMLSHYLNTGRLAIIPPRSR